MKILFIFFFILVSCSTINDSKVKKVYICGDHECANKKEINDYFKNNISIEIYTLSKSSKKDIVNRKNKNKPKITLVRICKDLQQCDIDNVANIIIKKGNDKKYPDLTIE